VFKRALSLYTKDLQYLRGEIQGIRIASSPLRGVIAVLRAGTGAAQKVKRRGLAGQGTNMSLGKVEKEEDEVDKDVPGEDTEGVWTRELKPAMRVPSTGLGFAFALTAGTFGDESIAQLGPNSLLNY